VSACLLPPNLEQSSTTLHISILIIEILEVTLNLPLLILILEHLIVGVYYYYSFTMQSYASAIYAVIVCLSVCSSHASIVSKWLNVGIGHIWGNPVGISAKSLAPEN